MATMNRENNRKENKASSYRNNDEPTRDEEENNTYNICGHDETFQTTTT